MNPTAGRIGIGFVGLGATRGWARQAHVSALGMLDDFAIHGLMASTPASAEVQVCVSRDLREEATRAPRSSDVALRRTLASIRASADRFCFHPGVLKRHAMTTHRRTPWAD